MRVLVVEDEMDLLSVLSQTLREAGFAVDEASDGQTGLFKAQGADYDAIVPVSYTHLAGDATRN